MDLQLAAYKLGKDVMGGPLGMNFGSSAKQIFPRKTLTTLMQDNRRLTQVLNRVRRDAQRTKESYNKQVQMFIDRERFQQNASWQAEYERLQSIPIFQRATHVQRRMFDLKDAMEPTQPDAKTRLFRKT